MKMRYRCNELLIEWMQVKIKSSRCCSSFDARRNIYIVYLAERFVSVEMKGKIQDGVDRGYRTRLPFRKIVFAPSRRGWSSGVLLPTEVGTELFVIRVGK